MEPVDGLFGGDPDRAPGGGPLQHDPGVGDAAGGGGPEGASRRRSGLAKLPWIVVGAYWLVVALLGVLRPLPAAATNPGNSAYEGQFSSVFPYGYDSAAGYWCYVYSYRETAGATTYWTAETPRCELWEWDYIPDSLNPGQYIIRTSPFERYGAVHDTTPNSDEWFDSYFYIVPPVSMISATVGCDFLGDRWEQGGNEPTTYASFALDARKDSYVSWNSDYNPGNQSMSFEQTAWLVNPTTRDWDYYVGEMGNWTSGSTTVPNGMWRWRMTASANGDQEAAIATLSCSVIGYLGEYVVPTPTPAPPTPTPYPTSGPGATPWPTPPLWSTVPTQPVSAGVEPLPTACYRVMWGYTTTVPVWDVEVGFPETEACVKPYTIDLEFLGWDFGAYLVTFGVLLGVGVLVSVAKRS